MGRWDELEQNQLIEVHIQHPRAEILYDERIGQWRVGIPSHLYLVLKPGRKVELPLPTNLRVSQLEHMAELVNTYSEKFTDVRCEETTLDASGESDVVTRFLRFSPDSNPYRDALLDRKNQQAVAIGDDRIDYRGPAISVAGFDEAMLHSRDVLAYLIHSRSGGSTQFIPTENGFDYYFLSPHVYMLSDGTKWKEAHGLSQEELRKRAQIIANNPERFKKVIGIQLPIEFAVSHSGVVVDFTAQSNPYSQALANVFGDEHDADATHRETDTCSTLLYGCKIGSELSIVQSLDLLCLQAAHHSGELAAIIEVAENEGSDLGCMFLTTHYEQGVFRPAPEKFLDAYEYLMPPGDCSLDMLCSYIERIANSPQEFDELLMLRNGILTTPIALDPTDNPYLDELYARTEHTSVRIVNQNE